MSVVCVLPSLARAERLFAREEMASVSVSGLTTGILLNSQIDRLNCRPRIRRDSACQEMCTPQILPVLYGGLLVQPPLLCLHSHHILRTRSREQPQHTDQ